MIYPVFITLSIIAFQSILAAPNLITPSDNSGNAVASHIVTAGSSASTPAVYTRETSPNGDTIGTSPNVNSTGTSPNGDGTLGQGNPSDGTLGQGNPSDSGDLPQGPPPS